jgi:serine/threonine-protein kinase
MSSHPRAVGDLQPMTPPALDRLIRKCLAKDPDARWQSAADVADELRWLAGGGSPLGAPPSARTQRRNSALVAWCVALTMAALAIAAWLLPGAAAPARVLHLSVTLPADEVVDGGLENLAIALSPDGQSLAYCARGEDGINLYLRRLDQRETTKIPGTEGAYDPFFSPGGEWIGYFSGTKLRKVSVRGGVSIALADSVESRSGTWADDQTIVFSPTFGSALMRLSAAGGAPEPMTTLDVEKRERTHRWPEALPGGEWVLFTVGSVDSPGGYDDSNIEAASLRTGERRVLVSGGRMARYAPPGYLVFARHDVLFAAPIEARNPKVTSVPVPVLNSVGGEDTSGAAHVSIAADGTLAYVPGTPDELDELVWVDMAGKVEPVGAPLRTYDQVRISLDGTQLLMTVGPTRSVGDVWRYDLARGTLTRVTFEQKCTTCYMTPDQSRLVYRTEAGPYQIRVQALDGSEAPRVIHADPEPILISGLTPDGSTVLFQKYGTGNSDVLIVPVDGSSPARALWEEPAAQYGATVSSDGKWLAYVSTETGVDEVYVRPASGHGAKCQVSVDGGIVPLWAPNGKELYFVRDNTMMAVSIDTSETHVVPGIPRKLFAFPPGRRGERDYRSFDITPDGKRFAMMRSANPGQGRRNINVVLNWSEELKARVPRPGASR